MSDRPWQTRRSGVKQQRSPNDYRTPYERDRTRLIHSAAFRRLQRKTQIFGMREGDFHRTRLTHSLEVDSIARGLLRTLHTKVPENNSALLAILPADDLITAIALSHDIGHAPFGHGGESALNYKMRDHGGFESNAQTLRLLTKLETSYSPFGLDLTRRTLLGIVKYPVPYSHLAVRKGRENNDTPIRINDWIPPKCYFDEEQIEVDWILEPLPTSDKELFQTHLHQKATYHSLDCSIMNIADDIAYGVHDLEDAIYLKLISREEMDIEKLKTLFQQAFPKGTWVLPDAKAFVDKLFHQNTAERKKVIGDMVNAFITSVDFVVTHPAFKEPLLHYNVRLPEPMSNLLEYFKTIVFEYIINSHEGRVVEYGGQTVIQNLFEAIASNPEELLSLTYRAHYKKASEGYRVICDYIACMTDEYAYRLHGRLFGLNGSSTIRLY